MDSFATEEDFIHILVDVQLDSTAQIQPTQTFRKDAPQVITAQKEAKPLLNVKMVIISPTLTVILASNVRKASIVLKLIPLLP